jgi:hypothetical protein
LHRSPRARGDLLLGAAIAGAALALYVATLHRGITFWDTGELQTVTAILGIGHPTSFPAFVLLGWAFDRVAVFADVATRTNLMCAVATAVCAGLLYATLRGFAQPRRLALAVALGFAFATTIWHDATRAEVQDVELLFRVLALCFALRFFRSGSLRDLFATALSTGFAGATHGIAILLVPALALLVAPRPEARTRRALAAIVGGVALGLLPYAYLPLRSAYVTAAHLDPSVSLGLAPGLPFWDYDHPATLTGFVRLVTGADFDVHSGFSGFLRILAYPHFAVAAAARVVANFGWLGAALALWGAVLLLARGGWPGIAIVLAGVLPIPYTESYSALVDPDRYYLFPLWCAGVALCFGAADLLARLPRVPAKLAAGSLVLAISMWFAAPSRADLFAQPHEPGAAGYIDDVLALTPQNAIVVAEWAYATPLAYAAFVQRRFGGRVLVSAAPDQYVSHYPEWLAARPLYIVAFSGALMVPGFRIEKVNGASYHIYRVVAAVDGAR